jgi:hypothetical protein
MALNEELKQTSDNISQTLQFYQVVTMIRIKAFFLSFLSPWGRAIAVNSLLSGCFNADLKFS